MSPSHLLRVIIGNIYELQPEKLHAWKRASRVERDPRREKPDTTDPKPPAS